MTGKLDYFCASRDRLTRTMMDDALWSRLRRDRQRAAACSDVHDQARIPALSLLAAALEARALMAEAERET
jgi:hypothetical protein